MCLLRLFSDTASFKSWAADTDLPVYSVRDAHEIRRKRTGETYGSHRIAFRVSERDWDDFQGQVQDAQVFLEQQGDAIRALLDAHAVSNAYLDFPLWSRLDGNAPSQAEHLPRALVALCARAGIGIELTLYDPAAFQHGPEAAGSCDPAAPA